MSDKQLSPGDVDIQEFKIKTNAGAEYDVSNMFVEFSVYENIFSNSMSAVISMVDTYNMISSLPIVGEERVTFKYKAAGATDPVTLKFRTYKVSERQLVGNKQIYKIHLITEEFYINATKSLSKYLVGNAETIISQLLKTDLKSTKPFTFDPSGNQLRLTAPWWSPFKCAVWAGQKAVTSDKNRAADYLFYETMSGFRFRSLSKMKKEKPVIGYSATHDRAINDEFVKQVGVQLTHIINMETPLIVDQLNRFSNDVYKTTTYAHDVTFKSLNIKTFDLDKEWDNVPNLGKNRPFTRSLTADVSPNVKVASAASYSHDDKQYDWEGIVAGQRNSSLMRLEMMKVDLEVWGIGGVESGNVTALAIGKYTQSDTASLDEFYSGKYLISAIHHRFAPKQYKMYMQLVKDSTDGDFK